MLNAIQPLSYIQPHRHASPPKAESFIVLRGAICFITFSESGEVDGHSVLRAQSTMFGIDIKPGRYHTFFAIEDDTVLFEVKPGPYDAKTDKDFASWAPMEGSEGVAKYLEGLMSYVQKDIL
jgi:cupin fold WbuC family metalloprotein